MSDFLKKNLIYLREITGNNQIKAAADLGLSRSTYANYETGINQPKLNILTKIIGHYDISFEEIMSIDLSKSRGRQKKTDKKYADKKSEVTQPGQEGKWEPTNVSEYQKPYQSISGCNVVDFESKRSAEEAIALLISGQDFGGANLYLPYLGTGLHIRVPFIEDSTSRTIKDGSKAVGTMIRDISDIRQGHAYLIFDKQDGLICKRLYIENKTALRLASDNEIYRPYKRHLKDIIGIFKIREVHSDDLKPNYTDDLRKEIREITAEINHMRRLIEGR